MKLEKWIYSNDNGIISILLVYSDYSYLYGIKLEEFLGISVATVTIRGRADKTERRYKDKFLADMFMGVKINKDTISDLIFCISHYITDCMNNFLLKI
jgi:hypothetical protein